MDYEKMFPQGRFNDDQSKWVVNQAGYFEAVAEKKGGAWALTRLGQALSGKVEAPVVKAEPQPAPERKKHGLKKETSPVDDILNSL